MQPSHMSVSAANVRRRLTKDSVSELMHGPPGERCAPAPQPPPALAAALHSLCLLSGPPRAAQQRRACPGS